MMVLVDTSVWSLAFRRSRGPLPDEGGELAELIREGRATIIGPVRQELLSGVRGDQHFARLRNQLRSFPDINVEMDDYELAARYFNRCRTRGIQGSNTDFLICAVASRRNHAVFTTDQDFSLFAKVVPVVLHAVRS